MLHIRFVAYPIRFPHPKEPMKHRLGHHQGPLRPPGHGPESLVGHIERHVWERTQRRSDRGIGVDTGVGGQPRGGGCGDICALLFEVDPALEACVGCIGDGRCAFVADM